METSFTAKSADTSANANLDSDIQSSSPKATSASDDELPKKRSRGKGLPWLPHIDPATGDFHYYSTKMALESDALFCNYGKFSSTATEDRYRCKIKGCDYIRKYKFDERSETYVSYFHGLHEHAEKSSIFDDQRGLTIPQKQLVHDAFQFKYQSSAEIIEFFRWKRSCEPAEEVADPEIGKLNNYIQNYKKKKSVQYYPSAHDLRQWCISHGPTTVDLNDEESFNTPFVLNHLIVRFFFFDDDLFHCFHIT